MAACTRIVRGHISPPLFNAYAWRSRLRPGSGRGRGGVDHGHTTNNRNAHDDHTSHTNSIFCGQPQGQAWNRQRKVHFLLSQPGVWCLTTSSVTSSAAPCGGAVQETWCSRRNMSLWPSRTGRGDVLHSSSEGRGGGALSSAAVASSPHQHEIRWHGGGASTDRGKATPVTVHFKLPDGGKTTVHVSEGTSVLEAAHENDVDLEGACEASLACSTCHVILPEDVYDSLPEPTEEEEDLLDMCPKLTSTSRLGCQVKLNSSMEGIEIELPAATVNFYVDGHVPKPH